MPRAPTARIDSLSVLNDCLAIVIAVGLMSTIRRAQAIVASISSAAGTTLLTRPSWRHSSAVYCSHRYQNSRAFFSPTTRAR